MTARDLAHYRPVERKPVRGRYRGYDIISMPPPSSGGVCLIEMLNILEGYDLGKHGRDAAALHDLIEAMKRAYADRAVLPRRSGFRQRCRCAACCRRNTPRAGAPASARRQRPPRNIRPGQPADSEGHNTTHFSVIDRAGNAVSNTYTLNFAYGLGLVAPGTGVLLNNELDDFTAKPGASNAYGLVGFDANLPAPHKRPLSSMTPTIVLKDGKPFIVTGSPGGSRIISAVLQVITNVIDFHMGIGAPSARRACITNGSRTRPSSSRASIRLLLAALERARPRDRADRSAHRRQFDSRDQGRLCRRRRPPHPRLAGGGVLISLPLIPAQAGIQRKLCADERLAAP